MSVFSLGMFENPNPHAPANSPRLRHSLRSNKVLVAEEFAGAGFSNKPYTRLCRMLSSAHVYSMTRKGIHCGSPYE